MLAVRTESAPLQDSVTVQKQIASLDPKLPVLDVRTMGQVIGESLVNASLSAKLVLAFAILSLLSASAGLYGVLSYPGAQRFHVNPFGADGMSESDALPLDAERTAGRMSCQTKGLPFGADATFELALLNAGQQGCKMD